MSAEDEKEASPVGASDDLVAVARAVKTRGLRGEIVAELLTDFPERFDGLEELIGVAPSGERKTLRLEEHWLHQQRIVLKFAGYDSIEEATALVGYEFAVPESERVELEEDEFYDWELEGCRVETVEGEQLGRVREVLKTGANDVLVVEKDSKREYLIPLAEEICVRVDIEEKLILVDAPEGLLEF